MKQENLNKIDLTASITAIFNHENAYEARIAKALLRGGIQTVCDLCCQTKEGLLNIRGIGNNSISAIEEKLNDAGLHLDMSEDELSAYSNQVEEPADSPSDATSNKESSEDSQQEGFSIQEMLDWMCEDLEKKKNEQRRFELAVEIYLREAEPFDSNKERAFNAIRKAEEFLEVYSEC